MKNLNCGLTTAVNYLQPLPRMVHSLVMAHEFGHNLGADHDSQGENTIYKLNTNDSFFSSIISFVKLARQRGA